VITITTIVMADHTPNATKSASAISYLINTNKINTLEISEIVCLILYVNIVAGENSSKMKIP